MVQVRDLAILVVLCSTLIIAAPCNLIAFEGPPPPAETVSDAATSDDNRAPERLPSLEKSETPDRTPPSKTATEGCEDQPESAKFARAWQIPGTEAWWKFGGFVKGDFIHDFQPAGTADRFVPVTIPTDGETGQNTLLQAKVTRMNLDVRSPSDWGVARGFVETDFFTDNNTLRIRHAYVEVGPFLAGQFWSGFTDADSIPRTLDFESPIAFLTTRQGQFRWTEELSDNLKWAISIENPRTEVDDIVLTTIPGQPAQPIPDFVTRLKYKTEKFEWFAAGLFRELSYRPDFGPAQNRFGWAVNLVGIVHPTDTDKVMGQLIYGDGLGRYRSGSDLGLASPTEVEAVTLLGGCFALTHDWTKKLSSTAVYSFAKRYDVGADPPDTPQFASYFAINLIWEPIERTTFGIEYLYGTNETKNDAFGFANRIQASVQYNFP